MKKLWVILVLIFAGQMASAQELNCQVSIITDNKLEVTSVEQEIFKQLEQTIYELMNNTQWTKDKFTVEERINCSLQLQVSSIPSQGTYSGSLQIQSTRPALNSNYNTTVFNFADQDVTFNFSRGAVLAYAPNQFSADIGIYAGVDWIFDGPDFFDINIGNANLQEVMRPFLFLDASWGEIQSLVEDEDDDTGELVGAGFGLQFYYGETFQGNLQLAFPLHEKFSSADIIVPDDDYRLVFDFQYRFRII